jgi:ABC-type transport system involved in cytochrome c biogenesis ATPase subunit
MLAGAIMLNAWAIALFFLRFWKKTRDPLFGWFALAFLLLGFERVTMATLSAGAHSLVYLTRLCAFLLIFWAICDKNRGKPPR